MDKDYAMRPRMYLYTILVLTALLLTGILFVYRNPTPVEPPVPTINSDSETELLQPPQTSESLKPTTYPVKVFFSKHPESDDDPSKVYGLARIAPDLKVGTYAVSELLKGPTEAEQKLGYFRTARLRSSESNCAGKDFTLIVANGIATLRFCRLFDLIGTISDGQAESEIRATLNQFPTVQKVVILDRNGDCLFNLSGMNLCKQ